MKRSLLCKSAGQRSELALFLKSLRERVDPDALALGPHARLPLRLGKRVTQQELAEAIGVSREWYAMLETAPTSRPSTALLNRVADALMLAPDERAQLFCLAVPEIGRTELRDDSVAALDAFSRLRSLSRRLWGATSPQEILTTASEQIAVWFKDATLVHTTVRRKSGLWECQPIEDKQERTTASMIIRELEDEVLPTPEAVDNLNLYPLLANAGDVGHPELFSPALRQEVLTVYARRRVPGYTFVKARVRSRTDLIACFCVIHEIAHSYSGSDRAALGAFAELASLALS
ncbi:MAG TPA: helix-turn-helix transcriptional regulator [Candidatus Acidoferrum sp.]|nr:helix-turn-helix transcriptional regulator [Candidatus Acidoferrum sp.]